MTEQEHVKIPDWFKTSRKQERQGADVLNPIEVFVLNNEPAGDWEEGEFLMSLQDMLDYVYTQGMVDGLNQTKEDS